MGVYKTTTNPASEFGAYTEYATVLDNGQFWSFAIDNTYGINYSTMQVGTLTASGSTYASSNTEIYLLGTHQPPVVETLSGVSFSAPTFSDTVGTSVFGTAYVYNQSGTALTYSATDSHTVYDNPLALSTLAGTYVGSSYGVTTSAGNVIEPMTSFSIASDGTYTGVTATCTYAGKLTQHGKTGVFDQTMTGTGSSCAFSGAMQGIMIPIAVSSSPQLVFQMVNSANNLGVWFVVTKS